MDYYLGQVIAAVWGYDTDDFMLCDGRSLSVSQYQALFAIIGAKYGGDGVNNFALPDLRGRLPMGIGAGGTGVQGVTMGQYGGAASVTLNTNNLPSHNHPYYGSSQGPDSDSPQNNLMSTWPATAKTDIYTSVQGALLPMNPNAVGAAGGGQPFFNAPPYVGVGWYICVSGIYPNRQ